MKDPIPPPKRSRATCRPTITTIDWRQEICKFLNCSSNSADNEIIDKLDAVSTDLTRLRAHKCAQVAQSRPLTYRTIRRVRCQQSKDNELYLDAPWVVNSGPYKTHLRGSNKIHNFELYLEQNKEVSFLVFQEHECCSPRPMHRIPSHDLRFELQAKDLLVKEYISNISDGLRRALIELFNLAPEQPGHPNLEDQSVGQIHYPYLWWFHARSSIKDKVEQLSPDSRLHLDIFQSYLKISLDQEWATVDQLLSTGYITADYTHYLFVPQEICILNTKSKSLSLLEAFTATDWLNLRNKDIQGSQWEFDGNFEQKNRSFTLRTPPTSKRKFLIKDLSFYPARFANDDEIMAIRQRGKMFWKCRHRRYVCYKDTEMNRLNSISDPRFMIDTATYKLMHPSPEGEGEMPNHDGLGPEIMSQDSPGLPDGFFMCLPTTLSGFNMQKKEWVILRVGWMEDVTWNEEAFKLLVINEDTKELVQAVVTNQLQAEDQTDMIRGKGNGLFILLHGGPGTGKTLTAESVAEIARKPLYKVTCGDIGTKAEDVEKYLEVVLLLGKTWGCVVLLDEADVFLEQRSLSNLERNALVSVFLRVLEYYDGILILTSNRVGTFDEAFRSRIQLTLWYENLTEDQRHAIWTNFVRRLEELERTRLADASVSSPTTRVTSGFGFDFPDIRKHIDELAKRNLNGREIRNAISTARQLATYKREPMNYKHLERVIRETSKFEAYITELQRGFSSDEISRDKGERV
ncbi:hypothetical protein F4777DRAFT_563917 [Nemania sp. FL0916]|nr:hypothetical protein F4777DRAFT_563917 [Nemania sp. FL0916]